jgi:hypothetical protein
MIPAPSRQEGIRVERFESRPAGGRAGAKKSQVSQVSVKDALCCTCTTENYDVTISHFVRSACPQIQVLHGAGRLLV